MACGGPPQGGHRDALPGQTLIQGVVQASGRPVAGAYVRLLDADGEFTAEVVSSAAGEFRFFAAPGSWTVRVLAVEGTGDCDVAAQTGANDITVALPA